MVNKKLGKRLMAVFLSAALLVPAPMASAAGLPGTGQLEELSGENQPAGERLKDISQEEGAAGNQEDMREDALRDAPAGSREGVPDNSREGTDSGSGDGTTEGGGTTDSGSGDGTTEGGGTPDSGSGDGTTDSGSSDEVTGAEENGFTVDGSGILTAYNGEDTELIIPETVGGIAVTGIAKDIFDEKKQDLTKVTILAKITETPRAFFWDFANLEEVTLPDTLETIDAMSFQGCEKLAGVKFPEGLKTIEADAFFGCISLKSIDFPANVWKVGERAFQGCTALESITFQDGRSVDCRLNQQVFADCTSLVSVHIPAKVEVYRGAFGGCTSLTEFTVADNSHYDAFDGCLYKDENALSGNGPRTELVSCPAGKKEVAFREGITSIMDSAFVGCTGLTSLKIPDTVTKMGLNTFEGCSSLTEVVLPKNIDRIEMSQFSGTAITGIEIPETVTLIRGYAFHDCQGLKTFTFPGTVSTVNQFTFGSCRNLERVDLQEGVEFIDYAAFDNCDSLKILVIPESVTQIKNFIGSESYKNLIIYGKAGSYAETYAKENKIKFSTGEPGVDVPDDEPDDGSYDISDEAYIVTLETEVYDYDGKEKSPLVTVKKGEEKLRLGTDFTVDYENNINPGTAKAIVAGRGEYTGTVEKTFTIKGIDISGQGFAVTLSESEYTYDGKAKEPAVTVTKGTEKLTGADFTVKYENNVNPGTAKAIVTGAGIYTGTVTEEFTVKRSDISSAGFAVALSQTSYTYDGKAKEPAVTVTKGTEKLRGTDFTVKYENNIKPGTAKAIVTGAGVYTGTVTKEFTIEASKDISGAGFTVTLSQTAYTYDGKAKKPAVTVTKGTEKLRGTDFTVKYENNIKPGTAKAIVTGAGVYTGTVTKEFTIKEAKKKNIGLTCKKVFTKKYGDKAFSLQAKAAKGAKITYKTSDKKVAVVDKKGKVTIKGTGIATITVKATASGYNAKTLKVTVKVSPSKASAPSLKTLRGRKLKVSWKKDRRATGYQVQYCTSKAFKKGVKTVTISKNKTITKTIPKLARGKRYYVRVRAYKSVKVNKKTQKLYGAWSSVKRSGKILR